MGHGEIKNKGPKKSFYIKTHLLWKYKEEKLHTKFDGSRFKSNGFHFGHERHVNRPNDSTAYIHIRMLWKPWKMRQHTVAERNAHGYA